MAAQFQTLDLSDLNSWRGLRPGMSLKDVKHHLTQAGIDTAEWDEDDDEFFLLEEGWGFELAFNSQRQLFQIAVENEEHRWTGKKIIGVPFHEALLAMQDQVAGAGWRTEDAVSDPFDQGSLVHDPETGAVTSPEDAALLYEGTLWLPGPGLGLVMCGGVVCEIAWRNPCDVPQPFVSQVTSAQLALSQVPDLGDHLRTQMTRAEKSKVAAARNPVQRMLNWLLAGAVVALGATLWGQIQQWQHAPVITGKFMAVEEIMEKFKVDVYRVEYLDPAGQRQEAVLRRADFYVSPREPGEAVDLRYLAGPPPAVHGLALPAASLMAKFMPRLLGVGGIYLFFSLIAKLMHRRKR